MKLNKEFPLKKWHSTTRPLASRLDIKLVKCYIWVRVLYGAEIWTFRKIDRKYLESSEIWCRRRMENIRWTDRGRNMEYCLESRNKGHPTFNKTKGG
jgi:hypothetical protein